MATVRHFKEKPGQMFGGKGVAVFRPFQRKPSSPETDELTLEARIALEFERAILRLTSDLTERR
jgi:hypothetical protein